MKKQWALIVLALVLFGVSPPSSNAAQKRGRSTAKSQGSRTPELEGIERFKESFQNNSGKVRLVALVSPT